jgi:hypothetical protein
VPYSTYQVVAWPPGLTVPLTVADVGPTALTGPVIAVGAAAAAVATQASAEAVRRLPMPRALRMRPPFAACAREQIGPRSRPC